MNVVNIKDLVQPDNPFIRLNPADNVVVARVALAAGSTVQFNAYSSTTQMDPTMDMQQWLLVTLTAGVGGSMLSVGSAAGVALMGQARGQYTFFGHLKWAPVIALGYGLSIWIHMLISGRYVGVMP